MFTEESLGIAEKATNEVDDMLVSIVLAAILQDLKKLMAIDLVEGLLKVYEE